MYLIIVILPFLIFYVDRSNAGDQRKFNGSHTDEVRTTGWTRRDLKEMSCQKVQVPLHTAQMAQKDKDSRTDDPPNATDSKPVIVDHCIQTNHPEEYEIPLKH